MDDDMFFNDYCIVCDRAIVVPKEPEVVNVVKKKVAAGTIRVKNPDGTITTRTANGQKTTRPPLRRGPNSANRLAALAAGHGAAPRPQPLTRSKTAESPKRTTTEVEPSPNSPESTMPKTPSDSAIDASPFLSPIYCSRACAKVEADRSTDLARKMSVDSGLHLITSGLPISGSGSRKSPYYGPPSPLFISGSSDTSSSSHVEARSDQAATSVPNFFHMHRDTDEAWRDTNRQRRSSVHPSFRPGQAAAALAMARDRSQSSGSFSVAGPSSDSLNSLWVAGMNEDIYLDRSMSGSGKIRMTPVTEHVQAQAQGGWPIVGLNSRVSTSVSSTHSSSPNIPAEFGSAPEHTLNLWHSYNHAFSQRDGAGNSFSRSPAILGKTPTPPYQSTPLPPSRRASHTAAGATLQRPINGTIRAKSKVDVKATWDSFGLDEVNAAKKRQERISGVEVTGRTPKQTISVGQRGCTIQYSSSPSDISQTQSTQSHPSETAIHPGALAIPTSTRGTSTLSPANGRTPTPRGSTTPNAQSSAAVPDLASLRLGVGASGCSPYLSTSSTSTDHGVGPHAHGPSSASGPKSTWNWTKYEKEGGRTYTVPEGLGKVGSGGKSGLFFFK